MARLRSLRSIILVERGELERASNEAAKAVSFNEGNDTPGPYHIKLSSQSPEAVCLACACVGDAAHLRKASRLIPRTKSNYASLDDGEAPEVMVDDVDPWLSLSVYLGNVAEEVIS